MKKCIIVCLAVVAACGSFASAAQAHGFGQWAYTSPDGTYTGVFYANRVNPAFWTEQVSTGATYQFVMTQQGPVFTELYDGSRDVTVRLFANSCTIRHPGTGGQFIFLYNGSWAFRHRPERIVITGE